MVIDMVIDIDIVIVIVIVIDIDIDIVVADWLFSATIQNYVRLSIDVFAIRLYSTQCRAVNVNESDHVNVSSSASVLDLVSISASGPTSAISSDLFSLVGRVSDCSWAPALLTPYCLRLCSKYEMMVQRKFAVCLNLKCH